MDKKTPAVAKRSGAEFSHIHNRDCISQHHQNQNNSAFMSDSMGGFNG
jgi:hypothetical protein